MTVAGTSVWAFDDIEVDAGKMEVRRGGVRLDLEPKALKVLVCLIENRRRAVGKEELLSVVWSDVTVTDNALTRIVAQLRKTLGDSAREAKYIETVPTFGYRFIGNIREPVVVSTPSRRLNLHWIWALLAAAFVIAEVVEHWPKASVDRTYAASQVQFTDAAGLDVTPSWSPDGNVIAYAGERNDRYEILLRPVTPGGREIQLTSDGQQNVEPAWSPDSRYIAYHSVARGGIWKIPATGGAPVRVIDFGSEPVWSPDGKSIAFRSDRLVSLAPPELFPAMPSSIWIVGADGSGARPLTRDRCAHTRPAFHPGGEWLVFTSAGGKSSRIEAISLKNDRVVSLVANEYERSFHPIYSSDGRSLFYARFHRSEGSQIVRVPIDPTSQRQTGPSQAVVNSGIQALGAITISPDGRQLAYSTLTMSSNLASLPMRRLEPVGEVRLLTNNSRVRNSHPVFSPDGRRIAFFAHSLGVGGDVWVMDPDGKNATPITTSRMPEHMPAWLPDSSAVAYSSFRDGRMGLWRTTLADRAEQKLYDFADEHLVAQARLSPDGNQLLFHAASDGVLNLVKRDIRQEPTLALTKDRESAAFGVWSPDGRWVAFELKRGDAMRLALVSADGGPVEEITRDKDLCWPFSWSADGKRIAVARLHDGAWNVWWIARDGGESRPLTKYQSLRTFVRYPAWSPKGDQMVFELAETKGNVFVAQLKESASYLE